MVLAKNRPAAELLPVRHCHIIKEFVNKSEFLSTKKPGNITVSGLCKTQNSINIFYRRRLPSRPP